MAQSRLALTGDVYENYNALVNKYYTFTKYDKLELREAIKRRLPKLLKQYASIRERLGTDVNTFLPKGHKAISLKTRYHAIGIEMKELKILLGVIKQLLTLEHVQNREYNKVIKNIS